MPTWEEPWMRPIRDIDVGILHADIFLREIKEIVERHGEKAKKLWTLASGYNPLVPPDAALNNLKYMVGVVDADLKDEAENLAKDLDRLFREPSKWLGKWEAEKKARNA